MRGTEIDRDKIRRSRRAALLTQQELAWNAKVSISTIRNFEGGFATRADFRTIKKLAEALNVQPHDLIKTEAP
jgi:transcriptional regulator with XRE-family HTH domain